MALKWASWSINTLIKYLDRIWIRRHGEMISSEKEKSERTGERKEKLETERRKKTLSTFFTLLQSSQCSSTISSSLSSHARTWKTVQVCCEKGRRRGRLNLHSEALNFNLDAHLSPPTVCNDASLATWVRTFSGHFSIVTTMWRIHSQKRERVTAEI